MKMWGILVYPEWQGDCRDTVMVKMDISDSRWISLTTFACIDNTLSKRLVSLLSFGRRKTFSINVLSVFASLRWVAEWRFDVFVPRSAQAGACWVYERPFVCPNYLLDSHNPLPSLHLWDHSLSLSLCLCLITSLAIWLQYVPIGLNPSGYTLTHCVSVYWPWQEPCEMYYLCYLVTQWVSQRFT